MGGDLVNQRISMGQQYLPDAVRQHAWGLMRRIHDAHTARGERNARAQSNKCFQTCFGAR